MKRGVLPVPCHHSIKVPSRFQGEPLELSDLSGSGWSEFAGQWFLVNRYEPYVDGSQHHVLNLRIGGRSGHSSLWLVDINERTWDVVVRAYTEAKADAKERAEWEKRRKQEAVEQDQRRRVLNTFEAYPEGEGDTKSVIAAWAGMSAKEFNPILASLLRDQVVEEFEITKGNGRRYTGYRKVGRRQQSDTPTDFKSE
jgi:alkylated DNA nucleotide flippase Atl1